MSSIKTSSRILALAALAVLYFLMGFTTVLNDTLVPFFKQGFNLNYSQSSMVQFYFFLTYGLISIPAGKLVGRIGYKNGMVAGFLIASLGALLFFPAAQFHRYFLFLAALFVIAMGIVILQVAANPYITELGAEKSAASRLTLIQGIGSVGTTLAPLFGAHFILSGISAQTNGSDVLVGPYLVIAFVLLIVGLVVFFLKLPAVRSAKKTEVDRVPIGHLLRQFPNLRYGVIGIFAYVGAEVAIGTYLTNYIADTLSITETKANVYVSYYWGGMLVGRIQGAYLLRFFKTNQVLSTISILASVLVVASLNTGGYTAVWLMVATGLCNSVMFASVFALSVRGVGASTGTASGLLSTAIVGGAIIPFCQGFLKDHFTWQIAFLAPVICYLYIFTYGKKLSSLPKAIKSREPEMLKHEFPSPIS